MATRRLSVTPDAEKVRHSAGESTARADIGRDVTEKRSASQVILRRLLAEGRAAILSGPGIDEAWTTTAAGVLARAISERDADLLTQAQGDLRRLAGVARRTASGARAHQPPEPGTPAAGAVHTSRAGDEWAGAPREVVDAVAPLRSFYRVEALLEVADAAAALVRPRTLASRPESGSLQAKILLALTDHRATPNEEVLEAVETSTTQLSRAFKSLVEYGLVQRRSYGRKVAWTLTASGQEAAEAVGQLAPAASTALAESPVVTATADKAVGVVATDDEALHDGVLVETAQALRDAVAAAVPNVWVKPKSAMAYGAGKSNTAAAIVYHRIDEAVTLDAGEWDLKSSLPSIFIEPVSKVAYLKIDKLPSGLVAPPADLHVSQRSDTRATRHGRPGGKRQQQAPTKTGLAAKRPSGTKIRHVVPNPSGGWDVQAPGAERSSAHAATQEEAIKRAQEIVRNAGGGEVVIHGRDGKIRDANLVQPRRSTR